MISSEVFSPEDILIVAHDLAMPIGSKEKFERRYSLVKFADLDKAENFKFLDDENIKELQKASGGIRFLIFPTRTYSEGLGSGISSPVAPEDRALLRKLKAHSERLRVYRVSLRDTHYFEKSKGLVTSDSERDALNQQREQLLKEDKSADTASGKWIHFDIRYLRNLVPIFRTCMTKPNRQDYFYLVTKTFGLNLAVRLFFTIQSVLKMELTIFRAVFGIIWYQLQDAVFTVFGQTYMKFLGKMTGMFRIGSFQLGDIIFVYFQLVFFEFLNRLIFNALGANPETLSWQGIGLIFLNVAQGILAGGIVIPAVNKMRRAGLISHSTMMHFYQISSLAMYFGMFATFGYQLIYTIVTTTYMVLGWAVYGVCSLPRFRDPDFESFSEALVIEALDDRVARQVSRGPL